ncbi:MAG: hypothetical protein KAY11_15940 [Ilumatobacteraceae bacterium]|nr:hypothetical protein [Ilumatobacteraceae bacterium]MBP8211060.1 hypothetical protein [Ilumatobacteraceae bacterium]
MSETPDDKIELLVRSVLTAVDMRLGEVRHEMHAVAAESEQRHRQVLQYMRDLEHRLERRSDDASPLSGTGDSLAQRMEEATQAMLERIDELHQRNTVATNERFALINNTLEQLGGIASASSTGSISPPSMMLSLDAMDAPLRVGPITAQQPALADAADIPLDISPAFAAPAVVAAESTMQHDDGAHDEAVHEEAVHEEAVRAEPVGPDETGDENAETEEVERAAEPSAEIDMDRLADLLSERLEHMSLPTQLQ